MPNTPRGWSAYASSAEQQQQIRVPAIAINQVPILIIILKHIVACRCRPRLLCNKPIRIVLPPCRQVSVCIGERIHKIVLPPRSQRGGVRLCRKRQNASARHGLKLSSRGGAVRGCLDAGRARAGERSAPRPQLVLAGGFGGVDGGFLLNSPASAPQPQAPSLPAALRCGGLF